jgi:hypothetical protein
MKARRGLFDGPGKLLTRDEARRIEANIAKLRELVKQPQLAVNIQGRGEKSDGAHDHD